MKNGCMKQVVLWGLVESINSGDFMMKRQRLDIKQSLEYLLQIMD